MNLADYKSDVHSQFGEDGMIEHIFERVIGVKYQTCVEFGASDGISCSNTANLWKNKGWKALLLEADPERYAELEGNASRECVTKRVYVERSGPNSIDQLLPSAFADLDFMSIDIDGEDWSIFRDMNARPRVVSIEYNQSIPPHISVRQQVRGDNFGASALALCEIAKEKKYGLVGLTKANLFFVKNEELPAFTTYERNLDQLFEYNGLTYLATDYTGHPVLVGSEPPWGLTHTPYLRPTVGDTMLMPTNIEEAKAAWEDLYGKALFIPEGWNANMGVAESAIGPLQQLFLVKPNLILIDVTQIDDADSEWIFAVAKENEYYAKRSPFLFALVREDLTERAI